MHIKSRFSEAELISRGPRVESAGGGLSDIERPDELDPQPTRVDEHPPLMLEHQLTGAPREARKACRGAQLILV